MAGLGNIGTAFIEVKPKTDTFKRDVQSAMSSGEAKKAGQKIGEDVGEGINQGVTHKTASAGKEIAKTLLSFFSAGVFVAGMQKAVNAASDLNEEANRTTLIFGAGSKTIDKYAKDSAKSMGLSERAYRSATSSLGGLLQNLGFSQDETVKWSTQLVALSSDLGSAFNTDPADAAQAIGAALRGESEPIRRYNIIINEAAIKNKALELGLYSGKGAIDANAKAQATLALITEQSKTSQGDFARTATGVANAQRIARAEAENASASFGKSLLPIYSRMVQVVGALAAGFGALPAPLQLAVVGLVGVAALAGPISSLVGIIGSVTAAIGAMGATATIALGAFGILLAAVAAGIAIWHAHAQKQKEISQRAKEVAQGLNDEVDGLLRQRAAAGGASTATQALADAHSALAKAIANTGKDGDKLTKAMGVLGLKTSDTIEIFQKLNGTTEQRTKYFKDLISQSQDFADVSEDVKQKLAESVATSDSATVGYLNQSGSLHKMNDAQIRVLKSLEELDDQYEKTDYQEIARDYLAMAASSDDLHESLVKQAEANTKATRNGEEASKVYEEYLRLLEASPEAAKAAAGGQEDIVKAQKDVADTGDDAADTTLDLRDAYDKAADAANDFNNAIDKVMGQFLDLDQAGQKIVEDFDTMTAAIKANGKSLDVHSEAGRKNRDIIRGAGEDILSYAGKMVKGGKSVDEAKNYVNFMVTALRNQAKQAGLTESEVDAYIDTLGLTPKKVDTAIGVIGAGAAKQKVQEQLNKLGEIPKDKKTEIQTLIDKGQYDEALRKILALAQTRTANVNVRYHVPGTNMYYSAEGRYVDKPMVSVLGEAGREAVLPLSNPRRMRELLGDTRISSPIISALDAIRAGGNGAGSSGSGSTSPVAVGIQAASGLVIHGGVQVGSRQDLSELTSAFDRLLWNRRVVG